MNAARRRILLLPLVVALPFLFSAAPPERPENDKIALAVIVNEKNPVKGVKLSELKSYLRLDRQFWPNRKRVALFLPPVDSVEKLVLNDAIYGMDEAALRKFWVRKIYAGEIPSIPRVVRTPSAAGKLVSASLAAITVVSAEDVPENVKVLPVDGKLPGDEDYPLSLARPITDGP